VLKQPAMEIILKYFSDFTNEQLNQLADLEKLYQKWNSKINIISRKDIDSLYEKHVLHSLSIAAVFDFAEDTDIIDIGTGGGFPGIPLAIFFPRVKFHLVDSIGKKMKVVESIASEIGLRNITTQHTRAEEIKNRKFDFAVSRAVSSLKEIWKWSRPLLKNSEFRVRSSENSELKTLGPELGTSDSELKTLNPGLICLKGGDLTKEIQESGTRPRVMEIFEIFPEEYFKEKYILHVSY
jgi:16S rRNA (guanine527-N7)-methyltransferase